MANLRVGGEVGGCTGLICANIAKFPFEWHARLRRSPRGGNPDGAAYKRANSSFWNFNHYALLSPFLPLPQFGAGSRFAVSYFNGPPSRLIYKGREWSNFSERRRIIIIPLVCEMNITVADIKEWVIICSPVRPGSEPEISNHLSNGVPIYFLWGTTVSFACRLFRIASFSRNTHHPPTLNSIIPRV